MLNRDLQQKVLSRLHETNKLQFKQEEIENEKQALRCRLTCQEGLRNMEAFHREAPSSSTGSTKVEGVREEKPQEDDTAPKKDPVSTISSTSDITGHESSSGLRNLKDCFSDGYYGEWAGFYNKSFPSSPNHRHMFWHLKYRTTTEKHDHMWFEIPEEELMKEYINRHKDEDVGNLLNELRNRITYSCSDPRMHSRSEVLCQ